MGKNSKISETSNESVTFSQGSDENNNVAKIGHQEAILKAKTLPALKVVSSNYFIASTADDGFRFSLMFPENIA